MPDGATALVHARKFARINPELGGEAVRELTAAPPPVCAVAAVTAFETLSSTRGVGFADASPITVSEVEAYSRTVDPLTPREVRWVLAQDAAYLPAARAAAVKTETPHE